MPDGIILTNIEHIFQELTSHITIGNCVELNTDTLTLSSSGPNETPNNSILKCGVRVKVFWSKENCEGTGWHEGWYLAVVKEVNIEETKVDIAYVVEPTYLYQTDVTQLWHEGKIKLHEGSELSRAIL